MFFDDGKSVVEDDVLDVSLCTFLSAEILVFLTVDGLC